MRSARELYIRRAVEVGGIYMFSINHFTFVLYPVVALAGPLPPQTLFRQHNMIYEMWEYEVYEI